jgi:hypothetical protein
LATTAIGGEGTTTPTEAKGAQPTNRVPPSQAVRKKHRGKNEIFERSKRGIDPVTYKKFS